LRTAAGAAIGLLGLGIAAVASSGTAWAGTPGTTVNTPVQVSASIPAALTLTLNNQTPAAFGTLTLNATSGDYTGSVPVRSTVLGNDAAGYSTQVGGVNMATSGGTGNSTAVTGGDLNLSGAGASAVTATCTPNIPNTDNTATATSSTTLATFTTPLAVPLVSTSGNQQIDATTGKLSTSTGSPLGYVSSPTNGTVGSGSSQVVQASVVDNVKPTDAAFADGLYSINCGSVWSAPLLTNTISDSYIPWSDLSVSGGAVTNGTQSEAAATATGSTATENATTGAVPFSVSSTVTSEADTPTAQYNIGTNLITVDSSNGVTGNSTNPLDSWTDTYALTVPGNQAAGNYAGQVNYTVLGN
jgi:hypothetical protein